MATRLIRVHPDDFAYIKGLYAGQYTVKIGDALFISMGEEKSKARPVLKLESIVIQYAKNGSLPLDFLNDKMKEMGIKVVDVD